MRMRRGRGRGNVRRNQPRCISMKKKKKEEEPNNTRKTSPTTRRAGVREGPEADLVELGVGRDADQHGRLAVAALRSPTRTKRVRKIPDKDEKDRRRGRCRGRGREKKKRKKRRKDETRQSRRRGHKTAKASSTEDKTENRKEGKGEKEEGGEETHERVLKDAGKLGLAEGSARAAAAVDRVQHAPERAERRVDVGALCHAHALSQRSRGPHVRVIEASRKGQGKE
eukprot:708500-Rhodomonas_salina.2